MEFTKMAEYFSAKFSPQGHEQELLDMNIIIKLNFTKFRIAKNVCLDNLCSEIAWKGLEVVKSAYLLLNPNAVGRDS